MAIDLDLTIFVFISLVTAVIIACHKVMKFDWKDDHEVICLNTS